jgi:hypothetical protein
MSIGAEINRAEIAKNFPAWAGLVGAALRSLPDSPCKINILGSAQKAAAGRFKDRPAIVAVAVAVGFMLLLPGIHGFWQSARLGSVISPQTVEVDEAEGALTQVSTEQKKMTDLLNLANQALVLEGERMRWPILLEEIRVKSLPGLWVTSLKLSEGVPGAEGEAAVPKSANVKTSVPVLEIGGFFETQSEAADAKVVEDFREGLSEGRILQNVTTTQRDNPDRVDGKTEQVALKFAMKAEWPVGGVAPVEAAKKPVNP